MTDRDEPLARATGRLRRRPARAQPTPAGARSEQTVTPEDTATPSEAGRSPEDAFAEVFARHHPDALRLAYLLCGDRDRAEDISSEVFAKLYRRWRRGRIEDVGAYVRRAVVNETNSRFRRLALERREARRQHADDRGRRHAEDDLADHDALLAALAALPQRQRAALVLRYYADLSERATAEAMGVAVGTVKSSVSRALSQLRRSLSEEDA